MKNLQIKAAELIRQHENDSVQIISHMDADGVCAAAIMSKALDRVGVRHKVKFVRMLYSDVVEQLEPADLTIFTDLGSSQLENLKPKFEGHPTIIADHHEPDKENAWPDLIHLNAELLGLDGVHGISGAGMTYLIAKELGENLDLSALAIIGAIGDVQNAWGKLQGYNKHILEDGEMAGVIKHETDLLLYGRYSRPLLKTLEFFTDPFLPGISNSPEGCVTMLKDLDIPLKGGDGWRKPADLTPKEKQRLASELIARAFMHVPPELAQYVPGLVIGESYTLTREGDGSLLKDASEFSTSLNSTARHEQPLIGLEVAKGDRETYYQAMLNLLRYHRRYISRGMKFLEQGGLKLAPRGYLQYFDATGVVKDTLVGTIAGLALGTQFCDPYKPIVGFACRGEMAKISARCSKLLFLKGLNLAGAIRDAAMSVGGEGGGHAVACGAEVEWEKTPEFLQEFERKIVAQLN